MKSRKTVELSERFQNRWRGYAAAAGVAGAGLLAATQPARADIVYTPANTSLPGGFGTLFLDVNNDGITDFRFFCTLTGGTGPRGFYSTRALAAFAYASRNGFAAGGAPLNRGAVIGPKDSFVESAFLVKTELLHLFSGGFISYKSGPWVNVLGYLGLEFQISGQTHFGWAELDFENGDRAITGYAYDTVAGQSLDAGQTTSTPEPGTLGLLGLGSLGLGFWRRKALASQQ